MVLVRIEVCDFKSYRGHQVIGPFSNFTSVIGPNGAGKSNLMDAISFVLGVKSAQLRSSQLKDLVYRGRRLASNAPSQDMDEDGDEEQGEGSAQTAWVLAVYEDEKKKEWRFQRTISTTGSSEYKLNNKVVTYTAYNAALVSHNILVKAKNFLVFQGDVEAVASQSSKELTRLIEQISGSLELSGDYEKAREAQERATENATFNFNKRRGINGEIKQYKEQKNEADKFQEMCDERDDISLRRILWRLFHIEQGLERNAEQIQEHSETLDDLRAERDTRDRELTSVRADQAKSRSAMLQKEKKIKKAEQSLEAKHPSLLEIETRIAHSTRKVDKIHGISVQVERDASTQETKVAALQKDLADTRRMANEAAAQAKKQAAQGDATLSQASLEEYRRLKTEANVLAVEERQKLETIIRDEKVTRRNLEQLREKRAQLTKRKDVLTEDKRVQSEKREDLEAKVEDLQKNQADAQKEFERQQSEQVRISTLETETNEKLQDVYQKLLQAGVDRHESEREVKLKETLKNLQSIFPGVRGRLVDLCQPTARKYETAVAVVLGRNIDAVVVDEERTAIECIEYMRNQRAGQATFIPLDTIQVKPINDKFRSFAKGSRLAVDVIQFDPSIERAIHHACGTALVCDTMEIARYICYEKGQDVKAVTVDGTVIHKSGLITGGRSLHSNDKKWSDQDYKGLQRVRDTLMQTLGELHKQKTQLRGSDNIAAEVSRLEGALGVARDDLTANVLRLEGINEELSHIKTELKTMDPILKKAEKEHTKLTRQMDELSAVINEAEDEVFSEFCENIGIDNIRQYEQQQLKAAEQESEARIRFDTQIARLGHQVRFEEEQLQSRRERLKALQSTVETEEAALNDLQQKREDTKAEIEDATRIVEDLRAELKAHTESQDIKNTAVNEAKRAASEATKALDQALKNIANKNDEIEKLASDRTSLYRKCRLENIPLPILQGNLRDVPMENPQNEDDAAMDVDEDEDNTQQPKVVADFGIEVDFEALEEEEKEDGSADMGASFDDQIAKLNVDIEKMAPNMKAHDRLEDVEAKLQDTEKEAAKTRQDSKAARDDFNDVKKKRCDLFNKAYVHISERIDQVYKELTKGKAAPMGGVAYLSLEDNEEPYLGGIKYHAMPPMKRFRDMEQLSGGEKTVAALALLFAIHSYQPSPFFVLDEVDAALDNTNVAKIANYIKAHAGPTFQFIVISLKGSLYERGQSLVGIYRDQDINSSKTLTLDLTQYDE